MISQFGSNSGIPYLKAAKCILHYLKGTINYGLILGHYRIEGFYLVGWINSNQTQYSDNCYSVKGFVFKVVGGIIAWSSKKQLTIATSLVEAEYIISANTTKEVIWLRTLLKEMGFLQVTATILFADNQDCIILTYNFINHSCTKNIVI